MMEGLASEWKENWILQNQQSLLWDYKDFKEELNQACIDTNEAWDAKWKLENYKQTGNMTANEFFVKFENSYSGLAMIKRGHSPTSLCFSRGIWISTLSGCSTPGMNCPPTTKDGKGH